jgi:hypothetical protein
MRRLLFEKALRPWDALPLWGRRALAFNKSKWLTEPIKKKRGE